MKNVANIKKHTRAHTQKMFTELTHDDAFWHWSSSKSLGKECSHNYEQGKQRSSKFFRTFIELPGITDHQAPVVRKEDHLSVGYRNWFS